MPCCVSRCMFVFLLCIPFRFNDNFFHFKKKKKKLLYLHVKTYPMHLCITTQIQVFNNNTNKKKNIQCCRSAHDVVDDNLNIINRLRTQLLYYCIVTKHQSVCFSCGSSIFHAPFVSLSSHFSL